MHARHNKKLNFQAVFRIRKYFLWIRIRRSVIPKLRIQEANKLRIRPDPDPLWTFLWLLKKIIELFPKILESVIKYVVLKEPNLEHCFQRGWNEGDTFEIGF
jgi:hypothetical protein